MTMNIETARAWLGFYGAGIDERVDELNQLDAALGDGDCGASLQRGTSAVTESLATVDTESLGLPADSRDFSDAATVLKSLLRQDAQVRLLTNNPGKYIALKGYGLEIAERVPLEVPPTDDSRAYLKTKREKMGPLLKMV